MPAEVQPNFGPYYTAVKRLGNGSFGTVYECRDNRTNESVAIKTMPRGPKITKYTEAEMVNHSRLAGHPHVINFKEVFVTDEHLCLVMEYAIGGTLLQFINRKGRLPEHVARRFFQQLILALDFCHKNGIAVRDIKLENVLLQTPPVDVQGTPADDSWLLKICDFGYSKSEHKSAMKSQVGTLVYMAPEILGRGAQYDGKAADIWSCGIMLYIMLCAKYPYNVNQDAMADHQQILHLVNLMKTRQFHIPPEVKISDQCRSFLMELLQPEAEKRITMAGIYRHPWFSADLPDDFESYNSFVLENSASYRAEVQTPDEISEILQKARRNPYRERLQGLTGRTRREREDALIHEAVVYAC